MPLDLDSFARRIDAMLARHGRPRRALVAVSGGRDSTVLLHLAARLAPRLGIDVIAVHVNHGLLPQAGEWQAHCERLAADLGVGYRALAVDVEERGAGGLEANARAARYRALAGLVGPADWLLTAHHRDDQAETVLLNLMRGSGAAGVRGAAASRAFAGGWLLRPLLDVPGEEIAAYAAEHGLHWIEDPSNTDTGRDRNYLRRQLLPLLADRWPAATRQLARSATLAAEACELLDELAAQDLAGSGAPERLPIASLAALGEARGRNLVRHACRVLGLPAPPARQLGTIFGELLPARDDAAPRVRWPGAEARRYRGRLYLLAAGAERGLPPTTLLTPERGIELGAQAGRLALAATAGGGIAPPTATRGLAIRYREGGEALRPAGGDSRRALKKLLQESGIVPWMRPRIPLLYAGDTLVAVGDLWIAHDHFAASGYAVCWHDKPTLY